MSNTSNNTIKCPLYPRCPKNQEFHNRNSQVFKEHLEIARNKSNKESTKEKQERYKQNANPNNDFQDASNHADNPNQKNQEYKDPHSDKMKKATLDLLSTREDVENVIVDKNDIIIEYNNSDRKTVYSLQSDKTYVVTQYDDKGNSEGSYNYTEDALQRELTSAVATGGAAGGLAGGLAGMGYGNSRRRRSMGMGGRARRPHPVTDIVKQWVNKYIKLFPGS